MRGRAVRSTEPPKVLFRLEYIRRLPGDPGQSIECVRWFHTLEGATDYQAELKRKPDATVISLAEYQIAWVIVDD